MEFFTFGIENGATDGSSELLGGKGAGLVWLSTQGVPVPPGFVIPTSVWAEYDKKPKSTMKAIAKLLPEYLAKLEAHFGYMPLLAVRSGARVSCPGMMDTILNVGIDDSTLPQWVNRLGPQCFADSFHRLVSMYGSVVNGIRKELVAESLKVALDEYKAQTGVAFPNAEAQLLGAIEAVFRSWDNERAEEYRQMHGYAREWGTAVTVQAMVFGNLNDQSGAGVLFTRNPDTGGMLVTGEYLPNAQGEDIVAGVRTPYSLDEMKVWNPAVHDELLQQVIALENIKRDMLDIEFTVQDGKLYLLQVRSGKRSATAALKIAVDMTKQGLIDATEAVRRVSVEEFDLSQIATIDAKFTKEADYTGLPACSGVVVGKPVFTKEDAIKCKVPCILVTNETTPDDIAGMKAAVGIVTMVGGTTCHAAVNARGMNRACIVGVGQSVDVFKHVEVLSLDGATGRIWTEKIPVKAGETNGLVREFSALVTESLGIVPVIFEAPMHDMSEALLYLGDQILNPNRALVTVLQSLMFVKRLYLDLVPSQEERSFLKIVSAHDHTAEFLTLLQQALPKDHHSFSRLVLIADAKYAAPYQRIAPGGDLRSLVLSGKEIVVDGIDASDPAIKQVLTWKAAEGCSVISIGSYQPGIKSMISVPAALQIIGNGKAV